jgi:hypothetical protein
MIADFIKFCDGWDSTKKTFFFWNAEEFYLLLSFLFFFCRGVWSRFRKIKKLFFMEMDVLYDEDNMNLVESYYVVFVFC